MTQGNDGHEHRSVPRAPFFKKVTLRFKDEEQLLERYSANISETGMFIQTESPQAVGTIIGLSIELKSGKHLLMASGIVRWVRTKEESFEGELPGMGIEFLDIHPIDQSWLKELVSRNQEADEVDIEVIDPLADDETRRVKDTDVPQEEGERTDAGKRGDEDIEIDFEEEQQEQDVATGVDEPEEESAQQVEETEEEASAEEWPEVPVTPQVKQSEEESETPEPEISSPDKGIEELEEIKFEMPVQVKQDEIGLEETGEPGDEGEEPQEGGVNVPQDLEVEELEEAIPVDESAGEIEVGDEDIQEEEIQQEEEETEEVHDELDLAIDESLLVADDASPSESVEPTKEHAKEEEESDSIEAESPKQAVEEPPGPEEQEVVFDQDAPTIGIDLGTTYSCSSVVRDGKVVIIPTPQGKSTIPSVVAWDDDTKQFSVGEPAARQRITNPKHTVYGFKRLIGRKFDSPFVEEVQRHVSYTIVRGENHDTAVRLGGNTYTLQEISSLVLKEIKRLASTYLEANVKEAVITVPAYYNENQRAAVRKAGELAGLKVTRIVNEPTAAAMAYGFNKKKDKRVLVYDLGGGTFDASLVNIKGNVFEVSATGGETFLGGMDFDYRLVAIIWEKFKETEGVDLPDDPMVLQRIIEAAEEAKRTLSSQETAKVELPYIAVVDRKPRDLKVEISREELENAVYDLVEKTLRVCDKVVASANLSKEELDAVLLTGGQSRMPLIHKMIEEHFGMPPSKGVHPDEAVAVGAALLAGSQEKEGSVELVDVLPQSIGVGLPGGRFMPIIPAQTKLPHLARYKLGTTRDNQKTLEVHFFQGESNRIEENEFLGSMIIANIPKGPKGSRKFEIAVGLNKECLLTVTVKDERTGRRAVVRLSTKYTPDNVVKKLGGTLKDLGSRTELDAEKLTNEGRKVRGLFSRIFGKFS